MLHSPRIQGSSGLVKCISHRPWISSSSSRDWIYPSTYGLNHVPKYARSSVDCSSGRLAFYEHSRVTFTKSLHPRVKGSNRCRPWYFFLEPMTTLLRVERDGVNSEVLNCRLWMQETWERVYRDHHDFDVLGWSSDGTLVLQGSVRWSKVKFNQARSYSAQKPSKGRTRTDITQEKPIGWKLTKNPEPQRCVSTEGEKRKTSKYAIQLIHNNSGV